MTATQPVSPINLILRQPKVRGEKLGTVVSTSSERTPAREIVSVVEQVVADAPPLTNEQRECLAVILAQGNIYHRQAPYAALTNGPESTTEHAVDDAVDALLGGLAVHSRDMPLPLALGAGVRA